MKSTVQVAAKKEIETLHENTITGSPVDTNLK